MQELVAILHPRRHPCGSYRTSAVASDSINWLVAPAHTTDSIDWRVSPAHTHCPVLLRLAAAVDMGSASAASAAIKPAVDRPPLRTRGSSEARSLGFCPSLPAAARSTPSSPRSPFLLNPARS